MSSVDHADARQYRYTAVTREGRTVRDTIGARDEPAALRSLMAGGLVVTDLAEVAAVKANSVARDLRPPERVLIMRQLALMLEAGVTLLEALESVVEGIVARRGQEQFNAVIAALKRGETLGVALRTHAPGFPYYVYAMAEVGESSGRVADVLRVAADQMSYEDRLRRDLVNALTYPALLMCVGIAAVSFIFVEILPRFSAMIGDNATKLPELSKLVFGVGAYVDSHPVEVLMTLAAIAALGGLAVASARARAFAYGVARASPIVGGLLKAREIATWARLTAFALANGVTLLDASALSRQGVPPGRFRSGLEAFENDLKSGAMVHDSLGRHTRLTAMDLSLLRTGQRAGTLAAMFGFLADSYDDQLKDSMKRFTTLVEPAAIGLISIVVGIIALSLVMALASIYDSVQ